MIDGGISMDLLARLLSTQLLARGEKHLLDRNRYYFKLLRQIVTRGTGSGARCAQTAPPMRSSRPMPCGSGHLLYDWCLCRRGVLPGVPIRISVTPMFLESYRGKTNIS